MKEQRQCRNERVPALRYGHARMERRLKSKKKTIFNLVFLLVVFVLTLYGVLRGQDIGELIAAMGEADWHYLMLAVCCVLLFICGQAAVIWIMMHSLHRNQNMGKCMLYSFTGYFFCSITPFASGGPPMQIYYMKKEKVPSPVASIVMLSLIHILQFTGAYKLRGAYYKISTLSEEERSRGLITASAGNPAQGVALSLIHIYRMMWILRKQELPITMR